MKDPRQQKLVGPVISLPTFSDESHNLLLDRQRKHIRWLISHGVSEGNGVLLVAGGYGEGYFLEDNELYALIDVLIEETAGKIPTMIGIFDLSARAAARKSRYAADAGIDFIELGMPHYSSPSEEDVYLYVQYINDHADVAIMPYNNFWVMPNGFELTRGLFERFIELEHVVGFKWGSATEDHYTGMLKLFSDQFNFIDNGMVGSQGARWGMRGFVDFYGNVAPRLAMKKWDLFKNRKYDELDELLSKQIDAEKKLNTPDSPTFGSVADGVFGHVRWKLMGLEAGPSFPAQAEPDSDFIEHTRKVIEANGMLEWVDFDQAMFD